MLYVDDVEKNATFWRAVGFAEKDRQEMDGTLIIEVGVRTVKPHFCYMIEHLLSPIHLAQLLVPHL